MSYTFDISTIELGDSDPLWSNQSKVDFNPGLTVLLGCNGSGKTTLLKNLRKHLEQTDQRVLYYDVHREKDRLLDSTVRTTGINRAAAMKKMSTLSTLMASSEGETIAFVFSEFMTTIGAFVRELKPGDSAWLLADSLDSGMSIDRIREVVDVINDCILPDLAKSSIDLYIVIAANDYAFTDGSDCVSMMDMSHIEFKSYDEYVKFIMETSKKRKALDKTYTRRHSSRRRRDRL